MERGRVKKVEGGRMNEGCVLCKGWVIWLDDYRGYWTGKKYIVDSELFPVYDSKITERTKVYSSPKRAERALELLIERFAYVKSGKIVQLKVKAGDQDA